MPVQRDAIDEFEDDQFNSTIEAYREGQLVGGRRLAEQQADAAEQERLENLGETRNLDAKIGDLLFVGDFSDPNVDILNTRETSEHDIISGVSELGGDGEFVVQALGRRPVEITVTGWIRENQLGIADELVAQNMVGVRTGRWIGSAVVEDVDIDYSRVYHEHHGPIFKTTISMLGVHKGELPDGFIDEENPTQYIFRDGELVGGRAFEEQQAESEEQERLENLGETMDIDAVVGDLFFVDDFSDPEINVTNSRQTQDHEIVTGHTAYRDDGLEYIVQAMGRNPADIDITGWIREDQLDTADALVADGPVRLISGRWTGTIVVQEVDVEYKRNYHHHHGPLFEIAITALGVQKGIIPGQEPEVEEEPDEEEEEEDVDHDFDLRDVEAKLSFDLIEAQRSYLNNTYGGDPINIANTEVSRIEQEEAGMAFFTEEQASFIEQDDVNITRDQIQEIIDMSQEILDENDLN